MTPCYCLGLAYLVRQQGGGQGGCRALDVVFEEAKDTVRRI